MFTNKESLKWFGSFETLKQLVDCHLEASMKWSSPGGGCKLYEGDDISIRCYTTNSTLTIKENKANELRDKLTIPDALTDNDSSQQSQNGETILQHQMVSNCTKSFDTEPVEDEGIVKKIKRRF